MQEAEIQELEALLIQEAGGPETPVTSSSVERRRKLLNKVRKLAVVKRGRRH